jgi:hypothetical protein
MERFFNTTGPCTPERHYMIEPEGRLVGAQLHRYIKNQLYWVLHAPRQTGKTTFLQSWMKKINASGEALACYVSIERCQGVGDAERAIPAICQAIHTHASISLAPPMVPTIPLVEPLSQLNLMLSNWAAQIAPLPLVLLLTKLMY